MPEKDSSSGPRVLVVGAGAIGCFYGGKLVQAGARVSAVCRSDYDAVKDGGVEVKSPLGGFHFRFEKVLRSAEEYHPPPEFILVGLKVLPEVDAPRLIGPAVGPGTAIVLIQNGIEIEQPLARAFPENEIISGLAFICTSRTGPGKILHEDYGSLVLGRYPRGRSERAERLSEMLRASGVDCRVTGDAGLARWVKLVWNAPFNPISVLAGRADTGEIMGSRHAAGLAEAVMEEVAAIAAATSYRVGREVIERNLADSRKMKPYKTSMLHDFEAKRPVEVEAILGNALRAAERRGVAAPRMETLYALLKLADEKNRRGS